MLFYLLFLTAFRGTLVFTKTDMLAPNISAQLSNTTTNDVSIHFNSKTRSVVAFNATKSKKLLKLELKAFLREK